FGPLSNDLESPVSYFQTRPIDLVPGRGLHGLRIVQFGDRTGFSAFAPSTLSYQQAGLLVDSIQTTDEFFRSSRGLRLSYDQMSACWDGVLLVKGGVVSLLPWQDVPAVDTAKPLFDAPGTPLDVTWRGPILAAPVCVGSLDETPDD